MSFADEINLLLNKKKMTQAQLAEELGVSRQAVQFWATGRTEPRGSNLARYREYVGLKPDEPTQARLEKLYRRVDNEDCAVDDDWTRVPLLDVYGSCGGGSNLDDANKIVEAIDFYTPFLRSLPGVSGVSDRFELIHSTGDSMEPTIRRHAICLVDRRQNTINDDGVYCIQTENQIFIKRILRNFDGSITMISDNPQYPPAQVPRALLDNATVIGRVVYIFNGQLA